MAHVTQSGATSNDHAFAWQVEHGTDVYFFRFESTARAFAALLR